MTKRGEVSPYVDDVRAASDSNGSALGFFAAKVFREYAAREKLFVAISDRGEYMGHLLFDRRFPKASVLQIFCKDEFRRKGVAKGLLDEFKTMLSEMDYISIRAGVADDLELANKFWESQGFHINFKRRGGASKGRDILVRVHELDTPQLFPPSRASQLGGESLGLTGAQAVTPAFLIDLNVLFDVARRRPHHDDAVRLLHESHIGEVRLRISSEAHAELARNAAADKPDPMLGPLTSLPQVVLPNDKERVGVEKVLSKMVFPGKSYPNDLSENDRSDIRHLATAALRKLGFVTRDGAMLEAGPAIEAKYGIQVLSPLDFGSPSHLNFEDSKWEIGKSDSVSCTAAAVEDYSEIVDLLERGGSEGVATGDSSIHWLPRSTADTAFARVFRAGPLIAGYAYAARAEPGSSDLRVKACIDESFAAAGKVAKIVLKQIVETASKVRLTRITLQIPERQSAFRQSALAFGFRPTNEPNVMSKIAAGLVVGSENWSSARIRFTEESGLSLPSGAPKWTSERQLLEVKVDGERRHIPLGSLESLLSPMLFALEGRPGVLVSIKPRYSEPLLGLGRQLSLAPRVVSEGSSEKMYLCSPRAIRHFVSGTLLFFYESEAHGAQAVIAVARVVDSFLVSRDEASEELLDRSVLTVEDWHGIGKSRTKTACVFDNLVALPASVGLPELASMGIRASRLVAAVGLTSTQVSGILKKGLKDA